MNKVLMQPRIIKQYVGSMDYVAGKLIDRIHVLAAQHNDHMPDDFEKDLQKWAFESIGVVSLNKHFGIRMEIVCLKHKLILNVDKYC